MFTLNVHIDQTGTLSGQQQREQSRRFAEEPQTPQQHVGCTGCSESVPGTHVCVCIRACVCVCGCVCLGVGYERSAVASYLEAPEAPQFPVFLEKPQRPY